MVNKKSQNVEMEALREQLLHAAQEFSLDAEGLSSLLESMVDDVERAASEPLEIVPVAHHSPASGLHMLRRLQERQPEVVFIEMCEDMRPLVEKIAECRLPVAFQAFASEAGAFPLEWAPLTVVAPITQFGAEYQAMAWAIKHGVELVFVDRSVDHIFQNIPQDDHALAERIPASEEDEEEDGEHRLTHGSALGIQVGTVMPTFQEFEHFLLRNARVHHFAEWWEQYVENTVMGADWESYRHVMCLVGSLLRRLGRRKEDVESDRWRERYMWTRIKEYLEKNKVKPENAMYICGAIHAVSDVEEYGTTNKNRWEIPPRTETPWLYGLIPSSYSAIERQFGHPPGTVSLAETTWKKGLDAMKLKPFRIARADVDEEKEVSEATKKRRKAAPKALDLEEKALGDYLISPPALVEANEEQLLDWCVRIVKLARENSYMATTADSIAIYQTSMLLAGIRSRLHPTPYDFRDAAVTCLEKARVPGKRDISWLCDILLGGDRTGKVGYDSLPPLARDVYDRLEVLPINLNASTIQRALMDFKAHPEYLPASDLLWKLHYLIGEGSVVRPIMGERTLGHVPMQESWDISIGKNQGPVIMLGYEGVTIEQVLELRLKKMAYGDKATTVTSLQAAEDSILFLKSKRLTREVGLRAVKLLDEERSAQNAPEIFERVRALVHYYRSQPDGLDSWIEEFVSTGYSHYATLLPESFADEDTSPDEIAGMLGFIFTLESLALSLGCDRSQLLIAIRLANDVEITPDKLGLLWSAQFLLGERSQEEIRDFFDEVMSNELRLGMLPTYISGFVMALRFTPLVGRLVVELLSKAFARLPDRVLMPWLPGLLMALKPLGNDLMPMLIKEAGISFPRTISQLDEWEAPWEREPVKLDLDAPADAGGGTGGADVSALSPEEAAARALLFANRGAGEALAALVGEQGDWQEAGSAAGASPGSGDGAGKSSAAGPVATLLGQHPAALDALAGLLEK